MDVHRLIDTHYLSVRFIGVLIVIYFIRFLEVMEPRTTLSEPIAESEIGYVITDLNALRHDALKAELEKRGLIRPEINKYLWKGFRKFYNASVSRIK